MSSLKERVKSLQADTSNTDTALTTLEESLSEKVYSHLDDQYFWISFGQHFGTILCSFLGAHHRASEGAARSRRPGEDGGTRMHQKGTERVEGEVKFAAGRPFRQRGEEQMPNVSLLGC